MFRRILLLASLVLVALIVGSKLMQSHGVLASAKANLHPRRHSVSVPLEAGQELNSEVRVRVFFDTGVDRDTDWRDRAVPAHGRVQFSLKDSLNDRSSFHGAAELDAEGVAVLALPPEWAARFETEPSTIVAEATLAVAPGLPALPAVPLDREDIFEVVELAFAVESGWILQGRVDGMERAGRSAMAHVVPGRVEPGNLAEWRGDARLRSHAHRQDLLRFQAPADPALRSSAPVQEDGSFGPLWLPRAEAAWVAIAGPRGFGTWRAEVPAGLEPGEVWNVGPVQMSAPTALELRVHAQGEAAPAGCRVAWLEAGDSERTQLEPPYGLERSLPQFSDYEPVLRAVDSALADLLFDEDQEGEALVLGAGGASRLAPLPPVGVQGRLQLILPDGRRTAPLEVEVIPGRTSQLEVDLTDHFTSDDLRGVCVEGRVLWEDGDPAVGIQLACAGLEAATQVSTDESGHFRIEGLAPGAEHAFQLTGWDANSPERARWRLVTPRAALERAAEGSPSIEECLRVEWSLERPRYLSVRGLELPKGAFANAEPMEWILEELDLDGGWNSYPAEVSEWIDRGARRYVRVSLPSASSGTRRLRLVVVWSPLWTMTSHPVELHPRGPKELESTFESDPAGQKAVFVSGRVLDRQGSPVADAKVQALCASSQLPPVTLRTNGQGEFRIEQVHAQDLWLHVANEDGEAEQRIDPRFTPFVELRLQ